MLHATARWRVSLCRSVSLVAVVSVFAAGGGVAQAMELETGIDGLDVRWDNTLKYNLGIRADERDPRIGNDPNNQLSDHKFDRGDIVTNRLDLLSELDVVYDDRLGVRFSGSAWYDYAYSDSNTSSNPGTYESAFGNASYSDMGAYPSGSYTDDVSDAYRGPHAELLDAFAFGQFDIGESRVNVRAGQHNIYWGESLFSFVHGVSYSQGPVDIRKAYSTPGTEAKELFLPLNQVSAQAQVTPELSVAGQYLLDWKGSRLPAGGTYLNITDFLPGPGTRSFGYVNPVTGNPVFIPVESADEPGNIGDFGISARWSPMWLDGTVGVYFRRFDEKLPWVLAGPMDATTGVPSNLHLAYAQDVKMLGFSLSKQIAGVSVGAEVVHRWDTALLTNASYGMGESEGAKGDTTHILVNGITTFDNLEVAGVPVYDLASLSVEFAYSRLDRITKNKHMYQGVGRDACTRGASGGNNTGDRWDGCSTGQALSMAVSFEPTIYQVTDGIDLSVPMNVSMGLWGNSPVLFGGNEMAGSYSLGLSLDIYNKYEVDLKYNDYFQSYRSDNGDYVTSSNGGGALLSDRGWVSLTMKTTF